MTRWWGRCMLTGCAVRAGAHRVQGISRGEAGQACSRLTWRSGWSQGPPACIWPSSASSSWLSLGWGSGSGT